jgi:glycosyltransferase involved in cell wall biosynthesis
MTTTLRTSEDNHVVLAVIPAKDEGERVAGVVHGVRAQGLDAIVVDDGSSDDTAERAREAGAEVLRHEVNRGKGAALATGADRAVERGAWAILMLDADGQHAAEEIPLFLKAVETADMVCGTRMQKRNGMPLVRWWTNRFMSRVISRRCGARLTDTQCGYRIIRASAWKAIEINATGFDMESELLIRGLFQGFRVAEVPIRTIYGSERSKIRPVRDALRWFRLLRRLKKNKPG